MKYMRRTAEYYWTDHTTNTEIAKELNITALLEKHRATREIGHNM
jgi:hypothetical protein